MARRCRRWRCCKGVKERRTGIARINQGAMDPNMLNRTATGASLMMSAGQAHLELIARCLAGGIKDLFLITHALALKHSTKPLQIRLQNKFDRRPTRGSGSAGPTSRCRWRWARVRPSSNWPS